MSELDKSLRALVSKYGLINISVNAHADNFTVSMQWEGGEFNGRGCVIEHGDTTSVALSRAVAKMSNQRTGELAGELAA